MNMQFATKKLSFLIGIFFWYAVFRWKISCTNRLTPYMMSAVILLVIKRQYLPSILNKISIHGRLHVFNLFYLMKLSEKKEKNMIRFAILQNTKMMLHVQQRVIKKKTN